MLTLKTEMSINGELFAIVKPKRLLPGTVLRSRTRPVYARVGPKQTALNEQIHTQSLLARGFPVATVLESGDYGDGEWYFTEESLGEMPFHEQFAREYRERGAVSDETFAAYRQVIARYCDAQVRPENRETISAREFIESTIPDDEIVANYEICGGDAERYHQAIEQACRRLEDAPMGVLQQDLNPYNVLERGVIDFELVGYGPIGYDTLLVSLWHLWFTHDPSSKYGVAYRLSGVQIDEISAIVSELSRNNSLPNPADYLQEFLLIKTAWAFSSHRSIHEEPTEKQLFYRYRARLLAHCVEAYLAEKTINPQDFPAI